MRHIKISIFFSLLLIPLFSYPNSANAHNEIESVRSGNWNSPSTWQGGTIPGYHDRVTISQGTTVTYNVSSEEMIHFLSVEGKLQFAQNTDTLLTVDEVIVSGTWQMGTEQQPLPLSTQATVQLSGETKTIQIEDGNFYVYGEPHSITWTTLQKTAKKGTKKVQLKKKVSWKVGDEMMIAPTGFHSAQGERRTITAISKNRETLTVNTPLDYTHLGTGYEFAEVGLLSHNILFRGTQGSRGGHIIFTGNSNIQIQSAAFDQLGNKGQIAQYPLHFHMMGDATGSFIKQVSVTDSKNRCITVHATDNVLVKDNVAYNTKGHCYFLEDGVEENNRFIHNVGSVTKAGNTLSSDAAPATFWVSNPNNTFKNNAAAGSSSFGFWFHLLEEATGLSAGSSITPHTRPLKSFHNNTTHSNERHGITVDGHGHGEVKYFPRQKTIFSKITAYKNRNTGIWMRGENIIVSKSTLVNNRVGLVFAGKHNTLKSSRVVGVSGDDTTQQEMASIHGVEFYDGPMQVIHTVFKNFESSRTQKQGALSMLPENFFAMSPENSFSGLTFKNAQKFSLDDVTHNGDLFTVIQDKNLQKTILPLHAFHKSSGCVKKTEWNAYLCNKIDYGRLSIYDTKDSSVSQSMKITRLDTGATAKLLKEGKAAQGEFLMNVPVNTTYTVSVKNNNGLRIQFDHAKKPITLQLPYSAKPEKITKNGTVENDWTYNKKKDLVSIQITPGKTYSITK